MKKVYGAESYCVQVECPECLHSFDATDNDDDNCVTSAMFENTSESCTDMDIEIVCPDCGCELILDELTY